MPRIGELAMYNKEVIRTCNCWRCKHRGEYDWMDSKKMYCNKTKRWGSPKRAYFCKKFESNSNSFVDPYKSIENSEKS